MPCLKIIVRLPSGVIRNLILLVLNALQMQMKITGRQVAIEEVKKDLVEKHANKFNEPQYKL